MNRTTVETVAASSLFQDITDVESMLRDLGARVVKFRENEEIVGYGDEPAVIVITDGGGTVVSEDWFGNRTVINRLGRSGIFGAAFAFSEHEVTTRLVADEKGEAIVIGGEALHTLCRGTGEAYTRLLYNAVKVISHSCVGFLEHVEHLSHRTMRDKVLAYLTSESVKHGTKEFDIPFSRQELADYLAVDRSALSTELGKMKREGLIDFHRARFLVKIDGERFI